MKILFSAVSQIVKKMHHTAYISQLLHNVFFIVVYLINYQ